jgi:hypothetical protein
MVLLGRTDIVIEVGRLCRMEMNVEKTRVMSIRRPPFHIDYDR